MTSFVLLYGSRLGASGAILDISNKNSLTFPYRNVPVYCGFVLIMKLVDLNETVYLLAYLSIVK
jgi:hypothetical protein